MGLIKSVIVATLHLLSAWNWCFQSFAGLFYQSIVDLYVSGNSFDYTVCRIEVEGVSCACPFAPGISGQYPM
jgi:hypothetical protein